MAIRRSRDSFFSSQPSRQRRRRAQRQAMRRQLHLESLEDRRVMAGPQLVAISPNEGGVLQDGGVLQVAPRNITFIFDEGQEILTQTVAGVTSVPGIRITRSGFDGIFGNANDVVVTTPFLNLGETSNEVIARFSETLPDDTYRIQIFGAGATPLRNEDGEVFNNGVNRTVQFELDLGAQIVAIVPQPIRRTNVTPANPAGTLVQDRNQIVVYFNNDDLLDGATSAENPNFYQLIFTNDTVTNADDVVHLPTGVVYDATADTAVLTFSGDLATLSGGGTYRLRVGTAESLPQAPLRPAVGGDAGSSFDTATPLGPLTARSQVISAAIDPEFFPLRLPGSNDEPGHREIPVPGENHLHGSDGGSGIPLISFNFKDVYGTDPQGNVLHNVITEAQKQRAREIFGFFSYYAGVQFQETLSSGLTIVTGDMRALDPEIPTGPGGIAGIAGGGTAIMDNGELWNDTLGGNWTSVAMHEIGHLLGLDHTYDLPPSTIMGNSSAGVVNTSEATFPADHDVTHIQHLYRPDSTDIDLYEFVLDETGLLTIETFAERLATPGTLDSVLTLYRQNSEGGFEQIARNDDYYSEDSLIRVPLGAGTYFIGVTSTGNVNFDPTIEDNGFGGTTLGAYELRLDFRPDVTTSIVDATGTAFDGDADGRPGGVYDFWFRTQDAAHTRIVDKLATTNGPGTLASPYNRISTAFAAAQQGDVVRIVGNGGSDNNTNTLADNRAYEIGFGALNAPLADGSSMRVPRGVTVMVDAGAVFKLRRAAIEVGSSSPTIDLSRAGLQVLGIPTQNVVFTSYDDEAVGVDTNPLPQSPVSGNWGGLLFRNDLDRAAGRFDYEAQGIFLNYVNNADLRFGGGTVVISSVLQTVTPIEMRDARPTIAYNKVTKSADAAISANPNSFEESSFHAPIFQTTAGFTLDYGRVGPSIYGNRTVENTVNGLFVRIQTPAGNALQELTVSGRFNDTDIVHVISENLVINGTPGGSAQNLFTELQVARFDARLAIDPNTIVKMFGARIEAEPSAQIIVEGRSGQEVIFTSLFDDRYGVGGTFDTSNNGPSSGTAGDWGGLYAGISSSLNLDHTLFSYAGGTTRVEGTFAAFNPVEIHQADARIRNTVFENSATGSGGQAPAGRFGRMPNSAATIFVRNAQPIIVDNVFRDNAGPAISINVNGLNYLPTVDLGRTTGAIDLVAGFADNFGPLVRRNRMVNNSINGMLVRGGVLTTESVWDDTDIVHVVLDEIGVPDFHTYGGLRLQSSATASLVVKLEGANAGFTANGRPLEIEDRIGGMLHILGQPGFPVVLTSLKDDALGDTNNDGASSPGGGGGGGTLPTGPEVDNGLLIDNDVATDVVGHFEVLPGAGGAIGVGVSGSSSGVTVQGVTQKFINEDYIFDFLNFVDTGSNGGAMDLSSSTITQPPTLISPDLVRSAGTFTGPNGPINWVVDTFLTNGVGTVFNKITFTSATAFGNVRFINYLDEDVQGISDDVLRVVGTPGQPDFRAFTVDGPEQVGFSHGGFYQAGSELVNASYDGWAADQYPELLGDIGAAGTTYTSAGNIDLVDLPPNNHPVLGAVNGPNDITSAFAWSLNPTATSATITTFLELIVQGGQTTPGGEAGDWRSVKLEKYAHDRNVDAINEREALDAAAPGTNATPDTARFLGALAPHEKSGDDNLRLGFTVHGFLNDPADVDVFSFTGEVGTEVWFDIDRTSFALDTVVELIDAAGGVIARSDNSFLEAEDNSLLFGSALEMQRVPQFEGVDFWTSNPKDAGMRLLLPGPVGTRNTYHVRVRSSSPDLDGDLLGGLTSGHYQLQLRLREVDELPGSTVRYADIRHATNGIEVLGQAIHSPLLGEAAEIAVPNELFANAQHVGNLLAVDRGALGIAGNFAGGDQVDWYKFTVDYTAIQGLSTAVIYTGAVFDMDYADGLARPNTVISVFDGAGNLILTSRDSNVADDRAAPFDGAGMTDLGGGSPGALDPYIGTQMLDPGDYYVAITNNSQIPSEMNQFTVSNAFNPLLRLEPIHAIDRIVEDHINSSYHSTFNPPQEISILDGSSAVPYHLGDVRLFISTHTNLETGSLGMVNPFTGANMTTGGIGSFGFDVGDIGMRSNGQLHAYSRDLDDTSASDEEAGHYIRISTGDGIATDLGDDNILTYEFDPDDPPPDGETPIRSHLVQGERVGDGIHFDAIAFADFTGFGPGSRGFAIGHRPAGATPLGIEDTRNLLYMFDPITGLATSSPASDREPTEEILEGAGTTIRERGALRTNLDSNSTVNNALQVPEATTVTPIIVNNEPVDVTTRIIRDGMTFSVNNGLGTTTTFEFNTGPEVDVTWDPATGRVAHDGDVFTLDGQAYEFNTGPVLVVTADNGLAMTDGEQFRLFNTAGVSRTFEFDDGSGAPIASGVVRVTFTSAMTQADLANAMAAAINGVGNFNIIATTQGINRITLTGDSTTLTPTTTAANLSFQGSHGPQTPGSILIQVEETFSAAQFNAAMTNRFNGAIRAGIEGSRLNFSGAITGDFTELVNRLVFVDQFSDGNVTGTNVPVNFLASDSGIVIATRVQTALGNAGFTASQLDDVVIVATPARFLTAPAAFEIGGEAPGGDFHGMAFVGSRLFGVTDTGGLYEILNYLSVGGATTDFMEQGVDLLGINFTGLSVGPQTVEGGAFANTLFGIDLDGTLFAFDLTGQPQGIFVDGNTSVETGYGNVTGLAFSTLDRNLWQQTTDHRPLDDVTRWGETGHGVNADFASSRAGIEGGSSMFFGVDHGTYDFPGGAHGSLESRTFSLEDYTFTDQPTMYFTYHLDTENVAGLDSFRVFIRNDSGQWDLLSSNGNGGQEAFDNSGSWRQVRVGLGAYAGQSNLRLRFDFSTAGSMFVGDPDRGGTELRALSGDKLRDGQTFTIDAGPNARTFEFDLGYTLILPTGNAIADGEQFTVNGELFEFNLSGGVSAGANAISINAAMSANEVTQSVRTAIAANVAGITFHQHDNRLNLTGATSVTQPTAGPDMQVEGAPGTAAIPLVINADMTESQVAAVIRQALANTFAGGDLSIIKTNNELIRIIGHTVTNAGPLGITTDLPGDPDPLVFSRTTAQNNDFEGVYIDDIVIGLAGRGEMATGAAGITTFTGGQGSPTDINVGAYQLEIHRSEVYGFGVEPPDPTLILTRGFDIRDRLHESVTLVIPAGADVGEGTSFTLNNGIDEQTFEYISPTSPVTPGIVPIRYTPFFTAAQMATATADAINDLLVRTLLEISAAASGVADRVNLFGKIVMLPGPSGPGQVQATNFQDFGDRNLFRDQGQILIHNNRITNALQYGILTDADDPDGPAGNLPHTGPPRNLRELDVERWAPGASIMNNIVNGAGQAAIRISGESDVSLSGAVPFARVVNNTLYDPTGTTIGIQVDESASPTLLNNVISGFQTGIQVDATSNTTVIGGILYHNNGTNSTAGLGEFPLEVLDTDDDALFIDAANGNFYPVQDSITIDSSVDSLTERGDMVRVTDPLGIARSPILAPDRDGIGQLRIDDPRVSPPLGLGDNVFKDRGAVERVDADGPTASLLNPSDNDQAGVDLDPTLTSVLLSGNVVLTDFSIVFTDGLLPAESQEGLGVDHASVMASSVVVTRDGTTLQQGLDYSFSYDSVNSTIRLTPGAGIWLPGFTYVITLDNQAIAPDTEAIRDLAGNLLKPNQLDGETRFTIQLGDVDLDFGDAPDPTFPTLLANDGAQHIIGDLFLGASVNAELDGQPSPAANLDTSDNGVVVPTLSPGVDATITVIASRTGGVLDAWIDFNRDGDWSDAGEKIFNDEPLVDAGSNQLTFTVPAGIAEGESYARFRISQEGGLLPTGLAISGEVEDYRVNISTQQFDWGDAPAPYPTLLADDGARHNTGSLFLGASVDAEADGQPSATANGDGADEDGVVFNTPLKLNTTSTITVTASEAGLLDAWIDFNDDGDWNDAGERVFNARAVVAGANVINLPALPVTAVLNNPTFMRFRLSSIGGLLPTGQVGDGEVEDYQVTVTGNPWQNGNQPLDANGFGVDVNGDGLVTPTDILLVDSELKNRVYSSPIDGVLPPPVNPPAPPPYFDVNGDGRVTASDVLAVVAAFNLVVNPIINPIIAPLNVGLSGSGSQLAALSTSAPSAAPSSSAPTVNPAAVTTSVATSSPAPSAAVVASPLKTAQPASSASAPAVSASSTQSIDTASFLGAYNPTQVVSAQATTSTTPSANLAASEAPVMSQPVVASSAYASAVQLVEAALLDDELDDLVDTIANDVDEAWQLETAHDQVFALIE